MSQVGKLDYSIDSAKLTSSTGEEFDIKDLITSFDVYESLLSPYIKAEVTLVDSSNLLEVAPILGQEKLDITITESKNKIKRTFYVGTIVNYVRANGSAAMYTMKLITPEQMMNSLKLVSQSYTGPISTSIENIVRDYLKSEIKTLEKSVGNYKVVVPNWNPYQAIEWLAMRAINSKQTPFAFYETLKDGYKFECYETIFNKKVYNKFVHKSGTTANDDAQNLQAVYNSALEYDVKEYSTTYKNALKGTFGSGLHTVDLSTKSYNFLKYEYQKDFKKKQHLDINPFLNPDFKIENKPLSEYDAYHHVAFKNTQAFGDITINNYNNEVEFTKLETDPYLFQLSLNKINMVVRGRVELSAGTIIEFEVDRDKPSVKGNNKDINEYTSGKYLVLHTHHKFDNGKYTIVMDVVRDSLGKKAKKR